MQLQQWSSTRTMKVHCTGLRTSCAGFTADSAYKKARLRKSADQPARLDNSFPDILEHELENGYEPDMEACVLAIGFFSACSRI